MMIRLAVAFLFAAPALAELPVAATKIYQPRIIAAADARADVALLRRGLETVHPGLYRYTAKTAIDAAFARLEQAASRPLTDLALHREVSLMLAAIHCDHTKAEMSDALDEWRRTQPTHLPIRFALIEGRMIVVSNDGQAGAPPRGAEIVEINGRPVPVLMNELARAVAYDGDTDQAIAAKLADDGDLMGDDFNEYYPSFHGFPDAWTIGWKRPGEAAKSRVVLAPISFARWTKLDGPAGPYRDEFYKSVTWRVAGKVARLRIGTFVNYRNPVDATAFLGGFFKTMKARGTEHLILDLRDNGRGVRGRFGSARTLFLRQAFPLVEAGPAEGDPLWGPAQVHRELGRSGRPVHAAAQQLSTVGRRLVRKNSGRVEHRRRRQHRLSKSGIRSRAVRGTADDPDGRSQWIGCNAHDRQIEGAAKCNADRRG